MRGIPLTRRQVAAAPVALKVTGAFARQVETASPVASPIPGAAPIALEANKTLVSTATDALFIQHEVDAVDRSLSPTLVQHNALIGDGPEALKGRVSALGGEVSFQSVRLFADGDLVAAHGLYTGFGPVPFVAFDFYRIENDRKRSHR